ncbi:MAG: hypothetical protein CVT92_06845 [Bacteroidetes bacterium HGW-Bacteroidetes-1]|nr:MAG: hypothetical protein CVT92_06845 [Bacteroidetes bacterium HGW-Bacteroidetes-1]
MINLHKYPFVRFLMPYGLGIWLANNFKGLLSEPFGYGIVGVGLFVLIGMQLKLHSYPLRWLFGAILSIILVVAGVLNVQLQQPSRNATHLIHDQVPSSFYKARLIEPAIKGEKTTKLLLKLQSTVDSNGQIIKDGLILAYIKNDDNAVFPEYGDMVLFRKTPISPEAPLNPDQFDYKLYLERKGVYHQIFLKESEWWIVGRGYRNPVFFLAYNLRNKLLHAIQENGLSGDEFHVASAILLGYDDHLPSYLRKGYTAAGAMHVLCVSGLHVGIIFLIFSFLLGFLKQSRFQQILKTVLLLIVIWFYALITGLSPSVLRATIMISFVLFGQLFKRNGFIINSLAASAFVLLWVDPSTLFNIGFQLSYSAVLGIVLLQKPIYHWLFVKNYVLDKIWGITSVAIAAQLATMPFVLHYFNQFPSYFMLSNLFLVPLSFFVIVSGMALLLTSFLPFIPQFLGWVTYGLIFVMNHLILSIEALPHAVISELYISWLEVVLLVLLISSVLMMVTLSARKWTIPAMLLAALLLTSFTWRNIKSHQQSRLMIYGLNRQTAIDLIKGRDHVLIADSSIIADAFSLSYNLEKHWVHSGLNTKPVWFERNATVQHTFFDKKGPLISFNGKILALWDRYNQNQFLYSRQMKVDYVLINGNTSECLNEVRRYFDFQILILDLSVPDWHAEKWEQSAKDASVEMYDIRKKGAFMVVF